ncbi:DNA-methyltransferase [Lacibacterium aquatile]|uniref:Methyltransferase n=1 Tax=Lacibacterium aquatile TaxID=1168082 RepID=A0ABW5DR64_9PROT
MLARADFVRCGDCLELADTLEDQSVDIIVTSPPYWGQRFSYGAGVEDDPRDYLRFLVNVFKKLLPKLKNEGVLWINLGDAYNTPINWRYEDYEYSSLGHSQDGLSPLNTAYTKPRKARKAFVEKESGWLSYGNLLGLPMRLVFALCENGYLFRGEVIWKKSNPMPEGRCRRPHRGHEPIFLLSKTDQHRFRVSPPVKSVWEFANERAIGERHYSRFPKELPTRCIEAYGHLGESVLVVDPFSGSGTTGFAARDLNCSYIGFEIDPTHAHASNEALKKYHPQMRQPR